MQAKEISGKLSDRIKQELKGFEGEMVMSYGVNFVPKGYMLDSEGHIVQKDLSVNQLKAFLAREYGEAAEQEAP